MEKEKGTKGFAIAAVVVVIGVIGFYVTMSNRMSGRQAVKNTSEIEKLLNYDFQDDYPKTVRETVKLHCRYMKMAYNNEFSKEELYDANKKIRELMDDELLALNTEENQLKSLEDDIQFYIDNKQKYVSYTLPEASQIKYNKEDDDEYAKIRVGVILRVDGATVKGDQEYLLRKDGMDRWKILGWMADLSSADTSAEE